MGDFGMFNPLIRAVAEMESKAIVRDMLDRLDESVEDVRKRIQAEDYGDDLMVLIEETLHRTLVAEVMKRYVVGSGRSDRNDGKD